MRQIVSVLRFAITVAPVGHGALVHADFEPLYLTHVELALPTGWFFLAPNTSPQQRKLR